MNVPSHIQFEQDSERILSTTLLAATPEEGCALLIGKSIQLRLEDQSKILKIQFIWPSENIWISGFHDDIDTYLETKEKTPNQFSKKNRFAIDPLEQLSAQKWARSKNLKVLGSAHSHNSSPPIPSKIDLKWIHGPNLMIILDANTKDMKAWWVSTLNQAKEIPLVLET